MAKTIDRAGLIKLGGLAGIAALLESVSPMADADAKSKGSPMNLTLSTKPLRGRGAGVCYTIFIGDKITVPANADLLLQTHAGSVHVGVKGNSDWHPTPNHGDTTDQWLTIYTTSCS
jgi:hypothetical protein